MKLLGLLGGMSAESTATYYSILNDLYRNRFGRLGSLPLMLWSVDFQALAALQHEGDWEACADALTGPARALEKAGAEALVITSNLMHRVAPQVAAAVDIPVLHIVDAVGARLCAEGVSSVCLLGARPTMEEPFYRKKLTAEHGITSAIPDELDREFVQRLIYGELCAGSLSPEGEDTFHALLDRALGAHDAVLLACTELQLAVKRYPHNARCFDTARIHAEFAFRSACS